MTKTRPAADFSAPHALREYALIADGERGVLVGPRGDYTWMCFPRWDSDACFATLIGGRGTYAVTPDERFVWGGYYERGLIWCSRWVTDSGLVECREALALPGHPQRAVLLRQIRARTGPARVNIVLDLRTEFGAKRATASSSRRRRRLALPARQCPRQLERGRGGKAARRR